MPYPLQPEPPPDWVCPICERLMRVRTIEVANGQEQITLACTACGTETTQARVLADLLADVLPSPLPDRAQSGKNIARFRQFFSVLVSRTVPMGGAGPGRV